jgi:hypothetical protein
LQTTSENAKAPAAAPGMNPAGSKIFAKQAINAMETLPHAPLKLPFLLLNWLFNRLTPKS